LIGCQREKGGGKLFVAKHTSGDDIWKVLIALDEKTHIVASGTIHWNDPWTFGARGIVMKWLEMLPIQDSIRRELYEKRMSEIIKKTNFFDRVAYKRIQKRMQQRQVEINSIKE
jgi:hypothetical protein